MNQNAYGNAFSVKGHLWAQTLLYMKLTALLLFVACLHVSARTYSQKVSLSGKNLSLEQIFEMVKAQTGYDAIYNPDLLKKAKRVSIHVQNADLAETLQYCFRDQPLGFLIRYNTIIVTTKPKERESFTVSAEGLVQGIPVLAISGKVLSETGEPLSGVSIAVKGTAKGTITGNDGSFTIEVNPGDVLVASFVGYVPQEIKVTQNKNISIKLKQAANEMDQVVVVGYGTQKKKDLTGAVSSVKFTDAPVNTFSSVAQALAGKAAGLQVSTISAQPGGQTTFNIRGATSTGAGNAPLIVIDGFPVSSSDEPGSGNRYNGGPKDNTLATLNPNDIESVVVLKDASATAIYGARAGHGVILITTKRGKEGKLRIDYDGSMATQHMFARVEALNASDWMSEYNRYKRERYLYDNRMGVYSKGGNTKPIDWTGFTGDRFTDEQIAKPEYNTDWVDAVTRVGFQQQHSLTMSGGSQKTKYLTSVSAFDQQGLLRNNNMKRFNIRMNLDQEISRIFKTGLNLNLNQNKFSNMPLGSGEFENAGVLTTSIQSEPIRPIRDANGNFTKNLAADYLPNAVSMLDITDNSRLERVLANAFLEATPISDLRLKAALGFDRSLNQRKTYLPKTTLYGQSVNGGAYISSNERADYLVELTADYRKTFQKHNLNALAGYSFQDFNWSGVDAGNQNFLIDGFLYNNLGAGAFQKPTVSSSAGKNQMASFFGRINYNYDSRYYFTATLRADEASNLAAGHQWGSFPSIALAWNISKENFFRPMQDMVSQLKLRVSYGETGNSNIGNKARDLFYVGRNYLFGGTESKGVYLGQMGNKALTWETTAEMNIGLDIELLNRINITAEYYKRTISDLLSTRTLMSFYELTTIAANIGKTQSKGFELTINTRNIERKDFSWTSDLTFSFYRDRWKERDPSWKPAVYQQVNDYIRAQFGYRADGLIQPDETGNISFMPGTVAGQVKLRDLDGFQRDGNGAVMYDANGLALKTGKPDGRLDDADMVFLGTTDPGYLFGFNNTFTYKQFDLNFYIYGVADQLKGGDYRTSVGPERIITDYGMPSSVKDFWSSENPNNTYFGLFQSQSPFGTGDYLLKKIWFARMRNITLGYKVPLKPNNTIQGIRIYVDVNNPFILTNYKGLDPETDSWVGGIYAYPNARTYSLGIKLTF
ncbi:MAG: TonB-dependent receptor [Chitinophagaceae bacterium]|nr:TonB-dependent receptor [Chitinophagaceae bacterium]